MPGHGSVSGASQVAQWGSVMRASVLGAAALVLGLAACSSPNGLSSPKGTPPTVLVTNPLCSGGTCRSVDIRAFILAWPLPQPPAGYESVGEVSGPSACLSFPTSWTMRVSGPNSSGAVDTAVFHWTPDDTAGIYLDGVHWPSSPKDTAPPYYVFGITQTFIPGTSPGWDLSFSDTTETGTGLPYTAHLVADTACTPDSS